MKTTNCWTSRRELQLSRASRTLCAALVLFGCSSVEVREGEKPLKKDVSIFGYQLGPPARHDSIKKLYIPRVGNETREPHLQMEATNVLINEFTREQSYEIVPRRDEADGILDVTLTKLSMSPVRYIDKSQDRKARGVPVDFRVVLYARAVMTDTKTTNVVWRANRIYGRYDFTSLESFNEAERAAIMQACGDLSRQILQTAVERW